MKWNRITVDNETGGLGNYPLREDELVVLLQSDQVIEAFFTFDTNYDNPEESGFGFTVLEGLFVETENVLGWVYKEELLSVLGETGICYE